MAAGVRTLDGTFLKQLANLLRSQSRPFAKGPFAKGPFAKGPFVFGLAQTPMSAAGLTQKIEISL